MDAIEHQLITALQKRSMTHVLQDLKCSKCGGIKDTNMSKYCKCGSNFTLTAPAAEFAEKMRTFRNIAKHYKMNLLQDIVNWIIQDNPV
ncbi:DNA polymerase epsilon catalytic subunit A, partial [Exaiptasia diaphana]|uniref:DNA polymerase epsilon catalytic subunit n=1 Tax=Exaiptasia diaphana TaxID=2652724 RepID=A0A913XQ66_EXADI